MSTAAHHRADTRVLPPQSSLGYFDHCNNFFNYRAQTPFSSGPYGPQSGPCSATQNITDLWDTEGPAGSLGHGRYIEELLSERAMQTIRSHDPTRPFFLYLLRLTRHCSEDS